MKNNIKLFNKISRLFMTIIAAGIVASCDFRPELPEAGSIPDLTPPSAGFTYIPTAEDFRVLNLTNTSLESIEYEWDFGPSGVECEEVDGEIVCNGGRTSTAFEPVVFFEDGEGSYLITLIAYDANVASDTLEMMVDVVDEFVPLPVTVINGDFEDGSNDWKISFSNGWNNNGFESSSDGSSLDYEGNDVGSSRGAKWNALRSVGSLATAGNTRVAYQPVVVSPSSDERTVKYILEFEYAIKDDIATDPPEGRIVIADVIAGSYTDGFEAYEQTDRGSLGASSLLHMEVSERLGKGNFTVVTGEFTAPESGLVSLMFSAITPVDVYVDNVKVYPAD